MKNGMDTQPIVDRMQAKFIRVLADTEVKQKPLVQGLEVNGGVTAESANSSTKRRASGAE
jgi:hypothetical protein